MKSYRNMFVGVLALMLTAGVVWAASNPQFIRATAKKQGNNLVVSFHEAGLGKTETVNIEASATANAVYAAVNKGGKNPPAENKRAVTEEVRADGLFTAKNGTVKGSLTLTPPPPPEDFRVPPGMRLVLLSVTYTDVKVTDTTNNVSRDIPGTF